MATPPHVSDSTQGYLSAESKRRFTLAAGILGAVVFVAQMILPVVAMFAVMVPSMMMRDIASAETDKATLWRGDLWLVEQTARIDFRDVERSTSVFALRGVRLADLKDAGPSVPIDVAERGSGPALLGIGDRLWIIGADAVRYYDNGVVTRLAGPGRPAGAGRPFVLGGRPAVISLQDPPAILTVRAEDGRAVWTPRPLTLDLPAEGGSLSSVQAVEAGGRQYLMAELCTKSPDRCSIRYREMDATAWHPLVADACSCASWIALAVHAQPAVVLSERKDQTNRVAVVTATAAGPQAVWLDPDKTRMPWSHWTALDDGSRTLLVSDTMPGSLRLMDVTDGRAGRPIRKIGSFPFGPSMPLLMVLPQMLPIALSLALALVLTALMRRHRVVEYVADGHTRVFASLWQRAIAQLVDIVPVVLGFAAPMAWMMRMFSDPESMMETGPTFPLLFLALFAGAFGWALLVLVAYSYFEGRSGKTPGKWLMGIRVLGTDLRPCGFGRALLRNLLTFVDGFFNFLVGALMVALTEHWQRLGDLAARTIVVTDAPPPPVISG